MSNKYKIAVPKHIQVMIIIVVALVLGYTIYADSAYYLYLIWNIFLAFLPFFISSTILWYENKITKVGGGKTKPGIFISGLILWLILFPNAPYLITDIIHLGASHTAPLWIDSILLFSSAYIGVFLGLYSLSHIEHIFLLRFGRIKANLIILLAIFLSSFGIYIGRFLRWNSWDLFVNSKNFFVNIFDVFAHPLGHGDAYLTTIIFFVFITGSYYLWKYVRG